jgi:hypothetical protein
MKPTKQMYVLINPLKPKVVFIRYLNTHLSVHTSNKTQHITITKIMN